MNKTIKRSIALAVCLIMLLAVLPMAAMAAETDVSKIMADAFALASGESMAYESTLTGKVVSIDTAYSTQYSNITVTIEVDGYADKHIQCFRLKGDGADTLSEGAVITVTGTIKNYNGTVEFDAGCTLDAIKSAGAVAPEDPKQIVDAAFALGEGESLPYSATLTGKVVSIDTPYDTQYSNVTVTIAVAGTSGEKNLVCYRMKGNGADSVAAGDTITVSGVIKNYVKTNEETGEKTSTIEFDAGCSLVDWIPGGTAPSDPKQIVEEAYALGENKSLLYVATLTGKVTTINEEYSEQYQNITVTIAVEGCEDKPIECYRLSGEGAADIKEGDTITVTGLIKRYVATDKDSGEKTDKVEFYNCKLSTGNTGDNSGNNNSGNNNSGSNNSGSSNSGSSNSGSSNSGSSNSGSSSSGSSSSGSSSSGSNNSGSNNSGTVSGGGNVTSGSGEPNSGTGDYSILGLVATMALAGTALVVLKKKEF